MPRTSKLTLRVAAIVFVPATVGALLLPRGSGGNILLGCAPCDAHLVGVQVEPTQPCLKVTPTVCSLGGEHLHLDNDCDTTLSLTSAFFLNEGTLGVEGGTGYSAISVPAFNSADLVAGPNAVNQNLLTLSGSLGGAPIIITIGVVEDSEDAGAFEDSGSLSSLDGGESTTDGSARDASNDKAKDASKAGGKDAGKGPKKDASKAGEGDARGDTDAGSPDAGPDSAAPTDAPGSVGATG
jgi:hypothetical protein